VLILKANEDLSCRNGRAETQPDFLSKIGFLFVASLNRVGNVGGREKHIISLLFLTSN
jgi:hypothetical protein